MNTINDELVDALIAFEQGELSNEDAIELFANLIKTRLVWQLQGSYGRMANYLIVNDIISPEGEIYG